MSRFFYLHVMDILLDDYRELRTKVHFTQIKYIQANSQFERNREVIKVSTTLDLTNI